MDTMELKQNPETDSFRLEPEDPAQDSIAPVSPVASTPHGDSLQSHGEAEYGAFVLPEMNPLSETPVAETIADTPAIELYANDEKPAGVAESPAEIKQILEAVLLSTQQPLTFADLRKVFTDEISNDVLRVLLDELRNDWSTRTLELIQVASGWRFRTRSEYMPYILRLDPEKTLRYSRAVLETLAIIAYRQPVTRGDIEDIRGVSVSAQIIKALEERGWIDTVGHRDSPGRPELLATTKKFLDDIGLRSVTELPPLETFDRVLELNDAN